MKKVLIIEDNDAVRENTAELLALYNYQVQTAENGSKGFDQAKIYLPDLVLCDMMMPDTDGQGFLKKLRKDSSLQHIPIVFFTAGTIPFVDQLRLTRAASGYLKKPFTKEELLQVIETALKNDDAPSAVAV